MSRRQITRIVRAVVAAAVAGTALAGCTVTVDGLPQAAPQTAPATPAPRTTAPAPTRPNPPALTDLGGDATVVAEWVADGWAPRPLVPVSEPGSGVSAWLFGTAARRDLGGGAVLYQSRDAPASVVNNFVVIPMAPGRPLDLEEAASINAEPYGGWVVGTRPVVVQGYPGLDARVEFIDPQGRPGVGLTRFVQLPRHLVAIESLGLSSDERVLQQVEQLLAGRLGFQVI